MSVVQLKSYIEGTVNAVIMYCLPVYANYWGVGEEGGATHRVLCIKEDLRRVQILQNKAMRCLLKRQEGTPWDVLRHLGAGPLSERTGLKTVHQMGVMATLVITHKMLISGKPEYVVKRFRQTKSRHSTLTVNRQSSSRLKLTGEGFMEQAAKLWNLIPKDLKRENAVKSFKDRAKLWVKESVPPKPP